jgi:putative ABC transport system substrate-binding protein
MKRREFIAFLGGAATTWPLAALGQQTMPVIGWLSAISEQAAVQHLAQFRRGLGENGFVLGQNVSIEYRWSDGQYDRLPAMAAELVRRPVDLILGQGPPAALAAKAATNIIPIVFVVGIDPVSHGLVASYSRPGGNATGATLIVASLGQKRIELLRELVPKASIVACWSIQKAPMPRPKSATYKQRRKPTTYNCGSSMLRRQQRSTKPLQRSRRNVRTLC